MSNLLFYGMSESIDVLKLRLNKLVFVDATAQTDEIGNWLLWIHHLYGLKTHHHLYA